MIHAQPAARPESADHAPAVAPSRGVQEAPELDADGFRVFAFTAADGTPFAFFAIDPAYARRGMAARLRAALDYYDPPVGASAPTGRRAAADR